MAWLQCRFASEVLGIDASLQALVPEQGDGPWPVLYLLHGLSDDDSAWCRQTAIERYATERNLAVVMPSCGRGFYTDMQHGPRWYAFLTEELPSLAERLLPISRRREETFVAGLSMGGYGAFKWALREPQRFAAAASLSGSLDIVAVAQRPDPPPDFGLIFADRDPRGGEDDLFALLDRYRQLPSAAPRLYQWCGTEDFLYRPNLDFRDAAFDAGLELRYEEGPGDHQWRYWDQQIQRVLDWLPLPGR